MSAAVEATPDQARALTDRIKVAVDGTWLLIQEAYVSRAWSVLGYASWDDYCTREFGASRLRLPREERQEVVSSLREIGMSTRAIAAATGVSDGTVRNALKAGAQNYAPAPRPEARHDLDDGPDDEPGPAPAPRPVIGTDGKTYSPPQPKQPQKPRTDVVATVNRALLRAQEAARAADEVTRQHLAGRTGEAAVWARNLAASLESLQRLQDLLDGES